MTRRVGQLLIGFLLLSHRDITAATPHRVLLVHSFGSDYAPFDAFTRTFRNQLAEQMGEALVFYDVDLASARVAGESSEVPFTAYLTLLFEDQQPDLVVTIGGPAARFAQRQRSRLFPSQPMLISAVDEVNVQSSLLPANDVAVCCRSDPAVEIENILQLLPATTNIAVVIGTSPLEKFWMEILQRDFQRFTNRVGFRYYNDLSFSQIQREVSHLPPRSAIFFGLLYVDAQGVPFSGQHVLSTLHGLANAPMFGSHETQLGYGIVGGRLLPITKLANTTVGAAIRLLRGEAASSIKIGVEPLSTPIYDWRELNRWGISEKQLPAGSIIRFREPGFWQLYKGRMLLGVGILCALLAAFHLRQAAQLRAAEEGRAAFTRQMILSQEDERRRIAGELHDGLAQVLVIMKNQLKLLRPKVAQSPPEALKAIDQLTRSTSQALDEVRAISHALRPAALEQVGLTGAIETLAREVSESSSATFSIEIDRVDDLIPPGSDINLYRIVQEGLNNVLKHARATHVSLEIKRLPDNNLYVSIFDNGAGFDLETRRNGAATGETKVSLGLVGMTERAKLLSGNLDIKSSKGIGTRVTLTVPLDQKRHQTMPDNPKNDSGSGRAAALPAPLGGQSIVS